MSAYKLNYTVHHHEFSNLDHITSDRVKFKHLMEITGQLLPLKHLQLSSQALALLELRQICICLSPKEKFLEDTTKESSLEAGLQLPVPTSASHECLSLTHWFLSIPCSTKAISKIKASVRWLLLLITYSMIYLNMYIVIYPATIKKKKYILVFTYQLRATSIFSHIQLLILNM